MASRLAEGWRLEGQLDWITSWDIADLALICVRCRDGNGDRVVGLLLPAGASGQPPPPGLTLGEPLRLLAMGGTHTRPARFESVVVPDSQVLFVEAMETWSAADAASVCRVSPVVFGCLRGAIADLHGLGIRSGDGLAVRLAWALALEGERLRRMAYALIDNSPATTPALRAEHRRLRARALDLALRGAQAALVAQSGAAMHAGSSAERRLREAAFLQVQAQTDASRQASLRLLFPPVGDP
jgi:alkylation response protein AidB-like acyl-CoA dehydrogenase